jgi:hypothetical protein
LFPSDSVVLAQALNLIETDQGAWTLFSSDPFFPKPPRRDPAILEAVKFAMQAGPVERKDVSRNARAVEYFAKIRGVVADALPDAIRAHPGGLAAAATLLSKAKKELAQQGVSEPTSTGPLAVATITPPCHTAGADLTSIGDSDRVPISALATVAAHEVLAAACSAAHLSRWVLDGSFKEGQSTLPLSARRRIVPLAPEMPP